MGESSKDGKGFISHPQQGFFKQPGGKHASQKSAIWVAWYEELLHSRSALGSPATRHENLTMD